MKKRSVTSQREERVEYPSNRGETLTHPMWYPTGNGLGSPTVKKKHRPYCHSACLSAINKGTFLSVEYMGFQVEAAGRRTQMP